MIKFLLSCLFLIFSINLFAQSNEYYLSIKIDSRSDIDKLTQIVSIDNVKEKYVIAYANDNELEKLKKTDFQFELLEHPSKQSAKAIVMATTVEQMANWDRYPTYDVYNQLMVNFVNNYSELCILDTIGTSVQNRNILSLQITSNIDENKPKPEVLFSSTMHGDETTGWILCMRLADYLLSNYGIDNRITNMLDSTSIFIAPNTNPDGTFYGGDNSVSGSRRYNYNGIDLNRDFPDPRTGANMKSQKENRVMMDFADVRHFILAINYHGGAELINYPWDTWYSNQKKHADNDWFEKISRQYADSAQTYGHSGYFNDENNGITLGSDWYLVAGGRQDYMNYWHNCREVTLEVSTTKLPAAAQLPDFWNYNRDAMLAFIENVNYGIRGFVTNGAGEPLDATITVVGHDKDNSFVVTNPEHGNYYRMIMPGTYALEFESDEYVSQTIPDVVVYENGVIYLNVTMQYVLPFPSVASRSVELETADMTGYETISVKNIGSETLHFSATIKNAQETEWLSLSNNSTALEWNESTDILIEYDFNESGFGLYEAIIDIDVTDSIISIPVTINYNFSGIESVHSNLFDIYPNPANENIIITLHESVNSASMEIYTVTGHKLYSTQLKNNKTIFNISDFGINNKGIFLINIKTENALGILKLIVK